MSLERIGQAPDAGGRGEVIEQCTKRRQSAVGVGPDRARQQREIEATLVEELLRLVDFFRLVQAAAGGGDAAGVFLGREGAGGCDAA